MLPRSRGEALLLCSPIYFSGIQCRRGHLANRRTQCGTCVECERVVSRIYRDKNKETLREKAAKRINDNLLLHHSRRREVNKRYRMRHQDRVKKSEELYKSKNPERWKSFRVNWHKNHPLERKAIKQRRRARALLADGRWAAKDITDILVRQDGRCYWCCAKSDRMEVDHIIPMARGGSNWPSNLCLACRPCNRRKSSKMPMDFICDYLFRSAVNS